MLIEDWVGLIYAVGVVVMFVGLAIYWADDRDKTGAPAAAGIIALLWPMSITMLAVNMAYDAIGKAYRSARATLTAFKRAKAKATGAGCDAATIEDGT